MIVIVCGVKLTHDGTVALIKDAEIVFSIELEKVQNNPRHLSIADVSTIPTILKSQGFRISDVDDFVIDGWDGQFDSTVHLSSSSHPLAVKVAGYRETQTFSELLSPPVSGSLIIDDLDLRYTSFTHAAGHVMSAYCTSPFAVRGEPSFVLVWDGGMFPRIYWVPPVGRVECGGELFPLFGQIYPVGGIEFGPFEKAGFPKELSIAGKLMAYLSYGRMSTAAVNKLGQLMSEQFSGRTPQAEAYRQAVGGFGDDVEPSRPEAEKFFELLHDWSRKNDVPDIDVLASLHTFLGDLLVNELGAKIQAWKPEMPRNLCYAGGCALNVKWNSKLRRELAFGEVWIPPFCNDSGSAIGAAAARIAQITGVRSLRWDLRLGPVLAPVPRQSPAGWQKTQCDASQLGEELYRTGRPIVVLRGRAEAGPRALGFRSILCAPVSGSRNLLNRMKEREDYRPIAPVCLESEVDVVFQPGIADPYMLFEQEVRPEWAARIPGVVHVDGTARVQTVNSDRDPWLVEVLERYAELSGIPVLCNTSANFRGSGFFPDLHSALQWGPAERVFADGFLYVRLDVEERPDSKT